jgi:hypothetical protein
MTTRVAALAAVLVLLAALAPAAADKPAALVGTVASIEGVRVELKVEGEKPAWVKTGSGVKVAGGLGKIVAVSPAAVTFNTKKAPTLKVGEKLTLQNSATVPAGC